MRQLVRHAAAVAVCADRRQSQSTNLRPLVCGDAALYVQRQRDPWTNVATDPRGIACHVHEGAQERRDAHVLQRRRDPRVVIGKRLSCVGISSHACPSATKLPAATSRTGVETFDAPRTRDGPNSARGR